MLKQADTTRWPSVVSRLAQRQGRWASHETTLGHCALEYVSGVNIDKELSRCVEVDT